MIQPIQRFMKLEASGGILVMIAAIAAMVVVNTGGEVLYRDFLDTKLGFHLGQVHLTKPVLLWINDGLMSVFFLLVGLEIKREIATGELSSLSKCMLPIIGAIGGMVVPALIYFAFTSDDVVAMKGWAIPTATDIAFALAILALLGSRVPSTLKIFVTALAIFDDIGAILIIAIFYAADISMLSLGLASGCILLLMVFNRLNITRITPYMLVGLVLWLCVLKSGVHATLAGVLLALSIPTTCKKDPSYSPLKHLEHIIHPWVAYLVLPLFAFANAGVSLVDFSWQTVSHPVSMGIIVGLFVGKQIGIFGATTFAVKIRLCAMPQGCSLHHLYGASLLCGVGFTMSLFIGMLAFDVSNPELAPLVRYGVILGSLLSGVGGYLLLRAMSTSDS
jgi:Na+:H+ antiporter, NhaA family